MTTFPLTLCQTFTNTNRFKSPIKTTKRNINQIGISKGKTELDIFDRNNHQQDINKLYMEVKSSKMRNQSKMYSDGLTRIKSLQSHQLLTDHSTPIKHQTIIHNQLTNTTNPQQDLLQIPKRNQQSTISISNQQYHPNIFAAKTKLNITQNLSPYAPKSYRRCYQQQKGIIRYRKHQDPLERRIVTIINKLIQKKQSQKDLNGLNQKLLKLTPRELTNKYVISGLRTIGTLSQSSQYYSSELEHTIHSLNHIIEQYLDQDIEYQGLSSQQQSLQYDQIKGKLVRKIYQLLKTTKKETSTQILKEYSISMCDQFSQNNIKPKEIIQLVKKISK